MSGAAPNGHFDPEISLVRETHVQRGGLGDDRRVDMQAGEEVARSQAAVLLIGNGGDEQIAADPPARFGEGLGGNGIGARIHVWSWFGVGAMGTGYGLGRGNAPCVDDKPPPLGDVPADDGVGAHWFRFSSRHAGGVQFCFGDGSVRTVKFGDTVSPGLLLTLPVIAISFWL